jgi:RimJ/RimL family protein N-acetyltransferase
VLFAPLGSAAWPEQSPAENRGAYGVARSSNGERASLKNAHAAAHANLTSQHELLAAATSVGLDDTVDLDLDIGRGLRIRALAIEDATMLVEATSRESAPALWGPRPAGPYSPQDAQAALSAWDPAAGGQFSVAILRDRQLFGAVGLMPDPAGSFELAYWIRPEQRGRGIASQAVAATTLWAYRSFAAPRIWLEINPDNEPSLRVAQRAGYQFEQRLPQHCRDWLSEDAEQDTWHDCLIWAHVAD